MMKHRMMTSLAIAAIAAATLGIPAFAGEMKQEAYTVTVKDAVGRGTDRTLPGLKNSDGGVTISVVQADGNTAQEDLPPQKTDENGNQYFEMADGSRIYVTPSRSASVN